MSFKSNPWLEFDEPASETDPDVYKQAVFLFSGMLHLMPQEDMLGTKLNEHNQLNIKKFSRRFNNDKI